MYNSITHLYLGNATEDGIASAVLSALGERKIYYVPDANRFVMELYRAIKTASAVIVTGSFSDYEQIPTENMISQVSKICGGTDIKRSEYITLNSGNTTFAYEVNIGMKRVFLVPANPDMMTAAYALVLRSITQPSQSAQPPTQAVYGPPEPPVIVRSQFYQAPTVTQYTQPEPIQYSQPEPVQYVPPEPIRYTQPEPIQYQQAQPIVYAPQYKETYIPPTTNVGYQEPQIAEPQYQTVQQTVITPQEINYGNVVMRAPPQEQFVQMRQPPKTVMKPPKATIAERITGRGKALYRVMISVVTACLLVSVAFMTTKFLESSTAKREAEQLASIYSYQTQQEQNAIISNESNIISPQSTSYGNDSYYDSSYDNSYDDSYEGGYDEDPYEGYTEPTDETVTHDLPEEEVQVPEPEPAPTPTPTATPRPEVTPDPSFNALIEANPDVVGWIKVPGTLTDNPVMQSDEDDPNFYLNHGYYGSSSTLGTIYADALNNLGPWDTSQNITLYGHRAKDGSMFGGLKYYLGLDFYKKNPIFNFDTLYEKAKYVIFAVFVIDANNTDPDYFEWRQANFDSDEEFNKYVEDCKARSYITTDINVTPGDQLVNLVTCTYEFDNARLVVIARKVRDGEVVDVSNATSNPNPLYPKQLSD